MNRITWIERMFWVFSILAASTVAWEFAEQLEAALTSERASRGAMEECEVEAKAAHVALAGEVDHWVGRCGAVSCQGRLDKCEHSLEGMPSAVASCGTTIARLSDDLRLCKEERR